MESDALMAIIPQQIAHSANGDEQIRIAGIAQLVAKSADDRLDRVGRHDFVEPVQGFFDGRSANDRTGPTHQQFQQIGLTPRQFDKMISTARRPRRDIEREFADTDHRQTPRAGAAQKRTQTGGKFFDVHRFDEIVVGAGIKAGDPVAHAVARRENKNRREGMSWPVAPEPSKSVPVRQPQVQNDDIEGDAGERRLGLFDAADAVAAKSVLSNAVLYELR